MKQQRKVYYTVGGSGNSLDNGINVNPKRHTKAGLGRKIRTQPEQEAMIVINSKEKHK